MMYKIGKHYYFNPINFTNIKPSVTLKSEDGNLRYETVDEGPPKTLGYLVKPIIPCIISQQKEENYQRFISSNNFTPERKRFTEEVEYFEDSPNFFQTYLQYWKCLSTPDPAVPTCDPNNTNKCSFFNGDLVKIISKQGEYKMRPYKGDICKLDIIGRLVDSGQIVEKFRDLEIQLGDLEVIEGLDFAIRWMNLGEISYIKIAPRFAYGKHGEKNIPRYAAITYKVLLKSIKAEPKTRSLSIEELVAISKKKRLRGNWWFRRMQVNYAITCYERALEYLNSYDQSSYLNINKISEMEYKILHDECLKGYYNLGTAHMKLGDYYNASDCISLALEYDPKDLRALYRKGLILMFFKKYEDSYKILLEVSRRTLDDFDELKRKINFVRKAFHEQQMYIKITKEIEENFEIWYNCTYERTNYTLNDDQIEDKNQFIQGFLHVLTRVTSAAIVSVIVRRYFC